MNQESDYQSYMHQEFNPGTEEARLKARNEGLTKRSRLNNPDMYHQEYDNRRMMSQQYMKNEYMQRDQPIQSHMNSYEYSSQPTLNAYPYQQTGSYQRMMYPNEYYMNKEQYKNQNSIPASMNPNFSQQQYMNREMLNENIIRNADQNQIYQNSRAQMETNTPYLSKVFLANVLFEQLNKLPQGKRMNKERKILNNMKRLHTIRKLKSMFK